MKTINAIMLAALVPVFAHAQGGPAMPPPNSGPIVDQIDYANSGAYSNSYANNNAYQSGMAVDSGAGLLVIGIIIYFLFFKKKGGGGAAK